MYSPCTYHVLAVYTYYLLTMDSRFNFAFEQCSLTWRALKVPLPPVGRGWGELLYLDDELRIQRDVRGDMIVATRAVPVDEQR